MKRRKPDRTPLVPERIGRYDVLLPIASGGMGTVYLARSKGFGGFERDVALKVMHAHLRQEEQFATDLIEEAKLAGRIQHPNVVQVLDVGDDPHGVFLVMEYIEGDSLAGLLRITRKDDAQKRTDVPSRVGLRILIDALQGLHAAHELTDDAGQPLGLVHRDFSPQNILVGNDGVSRLTDFGVAKASTRVTHTATGFIKGKVHYMSPEQAKTETIDRRCDIWAAGVIAWEMLARKRLYRERSDTGILLQLVTEPPPRLRTVRPDIPKTLDDAIAFALSTSMATRCPTAQQLASELTEGAQQLEGLADAGEIATYVKGKTSAALEKRRTQVTEVLKLRKEISSIAKIAAVDSELSATPSSSGSVSMEDAAEEVPTLDIAGRGRLDSETIEMGDTEDSRAAELRAAVAEIAVPTDEPSVTEISQSLSVKQMPATQPRRRRAVLYGAALLAVAVVAVAVVSAGPWESAGDTRSPALTTTAPATPPIPAPSQSAAAEVTSDESSEAPVPTPVQLVVTASTPIVEFRVGTRRVPIKPASKQFDVALTPEEQAKQQTLLAIAADGRQTRTKLPAGATEIALEFPVGKVRPRPPTKGRPAPLAPSPYDK